MAKNELRICSTCGTSGVPKKRVGGSYAVELVLWLFWLLPGLIYTIWRLSTKEEVCQTCGANTLVPLSSPVGQELMPQASLETTPPASDPVEQLGRLEGLRDRGLLSQEDLTGRKTRSYGQRAE